MTNTCNIIISRGKNQGKKCYEVNKKCRHKITYCPNCNAEFSVETSYYRHMKNCDGNIKKKNSFFN